MSSVIFKKKFWSVVDLRRLVHDSSLAKDHPLLNNDYLLKAVPLLPKPVEFKITKVIHATGKSGMKGILDEFGFRVRENAEGETGRRFLWCSLTVDGAELLSAQRRFLQTLCPDLTPKEVENHPEFLSQFTTSTAFQQGSRYGNFKFTFSLQELLQKYSKQFCDDKSPVLRVYKTEVYKKEIMHVVVIHSPDVHDFDEYPILQDNKDDPCALSTGSILWRPKAITDPCNVDLVVADKRVRVEKRPGKDYFMWEHGALAFHIPQGETLRFEPDELLNSLSACDKLTPDLCGDGVTYEQAKKIVAEMKKSH